jgi:hypothetical protein
VLTGLSDAVIASGLQRLRARRRVFSPTRGLYVVIAPEFRSWGGVPADWFIDDLMRHLGRRYYVALLSAAAYHGASHLSSREATVVDLVREPRASGGISNVATILAEIGELDGWPGDRQAGRRRPSRQGGRDQRDRGWGARRGQLRSADVTSS